MIVGAYALGIRGVRSSRDEPGWVPRRTRETVEDEPASQGSPRSTVALWVEFVLVGALVASSGWAIARAAGSFVERGGLEASFVGAALTGVVNGLPEAVTAVAAVQRRALTLAVASVLGGNAFDVLNLVVADVAFRQGSLYHAAGKDELLLVIASALLTAILLAGMLRRELRGPARIGAESWLVLLGYGLTLAAVAVPG